VSFSASNQGIQGHLRLVCEPDTRGISCLREQSFRAPIHLSKPFWEASTLVLNVVNPTAGLLEGDRIVQEATVRKGARILLTMPGASRAHRTREGWAALHQHFKVETGGFLEVLPEIFIPQSGAHYKQSTVLEVEEGGELLFFESLAPGRTASGEAFQYRRLDWSTDLYVGPMQIARERLRMEPGTAGINALRSHFPNSYYGTVIGFSEKFATRPSALDSLNALPCESAWVGMSPLAHPSAVCIKILAQTAQDLRFTMNEARLALYSCIGTEAPNLRRVAGR
jgi:urease accessory protein